MPLSLNITIAVGDNSFSTRSVAHNGPDPRWGKGRSEGFSSRIRLVGDSHHSVFASTHFSLNKHTSYPPRTAPHLIANLLIFYRGTLRCCLFTVNSFEFGAASVRTGRLGTFPLGHWHVTIMKVKSRKYRQGKTPATLLALAASMIAISGRVILTSTRMPMMDYDGSGETRVLLRKEPTQGPMAPSQRRNLSTLAVAAPAENHSTKTTETSLCNTQSRISSAVDPGDESFSDPMAQQATDSTFSACILFMDDNPRLVEWMAYHYYALNLREVVVAVDRRSKTSPWDSLRRWTPYMNITVWNDADYGYVVDDDIAIKGSVAQKTDAHRDRQRFFYRQCTNHLKRRHRTWTAFYDVDEYMTIDERLVTNAEERMAKPGSVLQMIQEVQKRDPVPFGWRRNCVLIPRRHFSAAPSHPEEVSKLVPSVVNADQLETLRWRYRTEGGTDGYPKSIVDVSKITVKETTKFDIHRVVSDACPKPRAGHTFLTIHHYLGDWNL